MLRLKTLSGQSADSATAGRAMIQEAETTNARLKRAFVVVLKVPSTELA